MTERSHLRLNISNFGSIKHGEVQFRPLTIFIGPNNLGKSYTALLLRTIYSTIRSRALEQALSKELTPSLRGKRSAELTERFLAPLLMDALRSSSTQKVLEKRFREQLIGSFGVDTPEKLVRRGARRAVIEVNADSFECTISISRNSVRLRMKWHEDRIRDILTKSLRDVTSIYGRIRILDVTEYVTTDVAFGLLKNRLQYLPAARSGISQSYRVVTASLVREVPFLPFRRLDMPLLSSPIADYLSQIISWERSSRRPRKDTETIRQSVNEFERSVLHGEIVLRKLPESEGVEISYIFKGKQFDLTQASSSIGELAPLLLMLKNGLVRRGDTLVLEEPEAHLHPASIVRLAQLLVTVVNYGINLVLTTHSDFFLSTINTLLKEHGVVNKEEQKSSKGTVSMNPRQTNAFLFKGEIGESVIERLRITKEGIPLDEFNRVAMELQERHVGLSN